MPCDDYWNQRWKALVRQVLGLRAPTRRTLPRKERDAATRAAISADVARFLGVITWPTLPQAEAAAGVIALS